VRTDFDIANDLKGTNLLTYREIGLEKRRPHAQKEGVDSLERLPAAMIAS